MGWGDVMQGEWDGVVWSKVGCGVGWGDGGMVWCG